MKAHQVNGIPFLLTLGFLLLFSSSFLAYLAWEGPGYQGSAAALEAPIAPPSLPGGSSLPPDSGKPAEPSKPAARLEVPVEPKPPEVTEDKPVAEPIPPATPQVRESIPQDQNTKAAEVASKKAAVQQMPVSPVPVVKTGKKPEFVIQTVGSRHDVATKVKKTRKLRKAPVAVVDETQIPPEWNWFSKPLRLELKSGMVRIVSISDGESLGSAGCAIGKAEEGASRIPDSLESKDTGEVAASDVKLASETEAISRETTTPESVSPAHMQNVLARLQSRREQRSAEAGARSMILPSAGGDSKQVPASLNRLIDALKALSSEAKPIYGVPGNEAALTETASPSSVDSLPGAAARPLSDDSGRGSPGSMTLKLQ